MWQPTQRNLNRVQFETYRKKVDGKFNNLHDELSDCYYNNWRQGEPKVFNAGSKTYDVQSTQEESEQLFDKLHGLIFHLHEQALEEEHEATPRGRRDDKFESRVVDDDKRQSKLAARVGFINDRKSEGIEITR